MGGNKLKRFKENLSFDNLLQPNREDLVNDKFKSKGKWSNFFKNNNPIVLELGCGKGEYTYSLANKYPNQNFIGIQMMLIMIGMMLKLYTHLREIMPICVQKVQ